MGATVEMVGKTFGRLTVLEQAPAHVTPSGYRFRRWVCQCSCGVVTTTFGNGLQSGHSKSCGCIRLEKSIERSLVDGRTNSPIYYLWRGMKARCYSPSSISYPRYGGRGIKVCERWQDFSLFELDVSPRPAGKSLERLHNDGDYEPGNCFWANRFEQGKNTRSNVFLTINGRTQIIQEWVRELGMASATLVSRYGHSRETLAEVRSRLDVESRQTFSSTAAKAETLE